MKKSILATTPFLILNKCLLINLGVDASLVLSDLIQKEEYFKDSSQNNGGYFFNVTQDISCSTTLSYYQIRQALSVLEKWGIIKVVLKGVSFLTSSIEKTEELDCKNFNNKILKNSNSINNNKEIRIKNKNVYTRKEKFLNDLKELEPKEHIEDFVDYWTEENNVGKERWMLEKTWSTSLRYKRWCKNQKNFSKGSSANNMPDFLDGAYINRIKEDQAQVNKFYKHLVENCDYERFETLTGYVKYRKKR